MVFKGLNEARSGKPQIVEVYKLSHSPSSLGLIGDDFGAMEFTGKGAEGRDQDWCADLAVPANPRR